MSHLMRDIVLSARKAFSTSMGEQLEEGLLGLRSLLACLQASDVGITPADLLFPRRLFSSKTAVKFMNIYEESAFTVTAFIVPRVQRIPLHDHPDMNGLIRCVAGRIRVTSYSRLPMDRSYVLPAAVAARVSSSEASRLIPCLRLPDVGAGAEGDDVLSLTPERGNIHEIWSESEASAFVDVLGPPYSDETDCHYFKVVGSSVDCSSKQEISWLLQEHPPSSYFTEVIPYRGPRLE